MNDETIILRVTNPFPLGKVQKEPLQKSRMNPNPLLQFKTWFADAVAQNSPEPETMALATATKLGKPSVRMVLLKWVDEKGFVFVTNYKSRKAKELLENPYAALTFYWRELRRQVRIEGDVKKISDKVSDVYFATRDRETQIGTWASPQSEVIQNREGLEEKIAHFTKKFPENVSRPPYWGGYRIIPTNIEFWQQRLHRLHDRIRYEKTTEGWDIKRLAP